MGFVRALFLFIAGLATAVALAGALAHAFEPPNKISMSGADYFTVLRIYDGWSRFAYVLAVQFVALLVVFVLHRDRRAVQRPALVSIGAPIAAQAVFWIWTFPANPATANWTLQPEN